MCEYLSQGHQSHVSCDGLLTFGKVDVVHGVGLARGVGNVVAVVGSSIPEGLTERLVPTLHPQGYSYDNRSSKVSEEWIAHEGHNPGYDIEWLDEVDVFA